MTPFDEAFKFKRRVYIDTEMDRVHLPTKIWCIVCKDLDTGERFKFRPKTPYAGHADFKDEFLRFAKDVSVWVGHAIITYDMPHVNRLLEQEVIKFHDVIDTLVLSRLLRPVPSFKEVRGFYDRKNGHSLDAWGNYLGYPKIHFKDFDKFSEVMMTYCDNDVELGERVYLELLREQAEFQFSDMSIKLEHDVAQYLRDQEWNGFLLDQPKANQMVADCQRILDEMDGKLQALFPPIWVFERDLELKVNKDGSKASVPLRILNVYQSNMQLKAEMETETLYKLYKQEVFNPESGRQIADRLLGIGWKPKRYTDKGNIKTDQETLQEALKELIIERPDIAEVQCLADYSIVSDRLQKAQKWLQLALNNPWKDGRVHGQINPLGASTHRASHYNDNMANIASVVVGKSPVCDLDLLVHHFDTMPRFDRFNLGGNDRVLLKYNQTKQEIEYALTGLDGAFGWDSRDCWTVPEGKVLVGCDASGIQLRALAHYMNDKNYIKEVCEGDVHALNQEILEVKTRAIAKTWIYMWLLGGGDEKSGIIAGVSEEEYEPLFKYAREHKKWDGTLLDYYMHKLRSESRKADKKTVATCIKGFIAKENFLNRIPALKRFKTKDIPASAKQGYVVGLDGRKIWVPSEHLTMGGYLQGFETVVKRMAMKIYHEDLNGRKIPFKQVAWVHDEFQIETDPEYGDIVGTSVVMAIRKAGEVLGSNCPLDGEYRVGTSWATTH